MRVVSIILAAGRGTRMRSGERHKVCFEIGGRPAINRAMEVYNSVGIAHHIVVVGALAGQVVDTVGKEFLNCSFVFQKEQRGTGHAAKQGMRLLDAMGYDGGVLVVAGDKVVEPRALKKLMDAFRERECDLAFLTSPHDSSSDYGRVIRDSRGFIRGILERRDIRRAAGLRRVYESFKQSGRIDPREVAEMILCTFEERILRRLQPLIGHLNRFSGELSPEELLSIFRSYGLSLNYRSFGRVVEVSPEEIESSVRESNTSVYLFRADALRWALGGLSSDNAQGEEYLTDAVALLGQAEDEGGTPKYKIETVEVDSPEDVMAFNDPDELLAVEEYIRRKEGKIEIVSREPKVALFGVGDWLSRFEDFDAELEARLREIYGGDRSHLRPHIDLYLGALRRFQSDFGESQKVMICRSPGRINLLGRHVAQEGGYTNFMAVDREVVAVVSPRDDDRVVVTNVDGRSFPNREFSIGSEISLFEWDDWFSFVNSDRIKEMIRNSQGDWVNYIKAAVLRLQHQFKSMKLRGMNMTFYGNIPIAAGLSSSSALVVATAEAAIAVNGLDMVPQQLVDMCGEGEWLVGTRGGSADHAAVVFGRRGKVSHTHFFDFRIEREVDFPDGYTLVICDSGVSSKDSPQRRERLNRRIAAYEIGLALIRRNFPQYAPLIKYLRDVNAQALGVPLRRIYEIVKSLPQTVRHRDLRELLDGDSISRIESLFASERPEDKACDVRGVVLFGLSECERSRTCADILESGDVERLGRLMRVSHDGDRIVAHDDELNPTPFSPPLSDDYFDRLIVDLMSEDPARVSQAQLALQPGRYACSTPEVDLIVDIAGRVPGVVGAQLAGAGLGGCAMVLVREDAVGDLLRGLEERYYGPRGILPNVHPCRPVEGAGILSPPHKAR
ncbi:MAG: GHMP family kinase ATP-binding protein [bacterium]